jgi:hypothetical protein
VCQDFTQEASPGRKTADNSEMESDTTLLRNEIEERRRLLVNKQNASLQKKTKADIESQRKEELR